MKKYKYTEPKFFEGETVEFFLHNSTNIVTGYITNVETHYSKDGEARHVYSILRCGMERQLHVGEGKIRFKLDT
jgi:hypothetical protein